MAPINWVVVGMGHFAQTAVLPAFANVPSARLVGLASSDAAKRRSLGNKHKVETEHPDAFADLLKRTNADAAYIVTPNHVHLDLALQAMKAGVHVLCEKPMATTEADCRRMIKAAASRRVKLMIAYRLHFEPANMSMVNMVAKGRIGDPRSFISSFTFQLQEGNVRAVKTDLGGGPLFDIGVYCINAARYAFKDEPISVTARTTTPAKGRFRAIEEQVSVILQFPEGRTATFNVGFGAAASSWYEVLGTKGSIRLDPGFSHSGALKLVVRNEKGEAGKPRTFARQDQVAAELKYFGRCVTENRAPEPSGREGLADVRIVRAALQSARTDRTVALRPFVKHARPGKHQTGSASPARDVKRTIKVQAPKR